MSDEVSTKEELKKRVRHNHAYHPPQSADVVSRHEFIRQITADLGENLIDYILVTVFLSGCRLG